MGRFTRIDSVMSVLTYVVYPGMKEDIKNEDK